MAYAATRNAKLLGPDKISIGCGTATGLASAARLQLDGVDFTAVGAPVPLQGEVRKPVMPCELVAYVVENLHQHMPDSYLSLLGAPPLPFSIGFGSILRPRDKVPGATPAAALTLDVAHL